MHVFFLPLYLLMMYFIGSVDVAKLLNSRCYKNCSKLYLFVLEKIKMNSSKCGIRKFISTSDLPSIIDCMKCFFAIFFTKVFVNSDNNFISLVAIAVNLGYYFPFFKKNTSKPNNSLSIVISGCVLDCITGISMIIAYVIAIKKSHHKTVASISSVLVGMIKALVHVVIFSKQDYVEILFFVYFGMFIIMKNKKVVGFLLDRTFAKKQKNCGKKQSKNNDIYCEIKTKFSSFCDAFCKSKYSCGGKNVDNEIHKKTSEKNILVGNTNKTLNAKKYKKKNNSGKVFRKESNYSNKYKRLKNYVIMNSQKWN